MRYITEAQLHFLQKAGRQLMLKRCWIAASATSPRKDGEKKFLREVFYSVTALCIPVLAFLISSSP